MERISLPLRTVTRTPWIAAVVGGAVVVAALLWAFDMLLVVRTNRLFGDWRTIVLTRGDIRLQQSVSLVLEARERKKTLFNEDGPDGPRFKVQPAAGRAVDGDSWDGAKRYLYARGFWRDANTASTGGITAGGAPRSEQVDKAIFYLREAVRREPLNCGYRQTLAEALWTANPAANGPEALRLVVDAPPQNAWGQKRAAELLQDLQDPEAAKRGYLACYLRSLELVPVEITSGIMDMRAQELGESTAGALADRVVRLDVDGLTHALGRYSTGLWSGSTVFKNLPPGVHNLVALNLLASKDTEGADQEFHAVVQSAQDRYLASPRASAIWFLLDVINPFMRPDPARRYVSPEDLGLAASVLRERLDKGDESLKFYGVVTSRHPGWVPGHVGLARALAALAQQEEDEAERLKVTDKPASDQKRSDARALRARADEELSLALALDPKSSEALAVRGILHSRGAGAATP